jgi:bleomycin hydrolase
MWIFLSIPVFSLVATADGRQSDKSAYEFTIDHEVNRTSVKDQYNTGTCWCFATLSLLESELMRIGRDEIDLSEMFVVRHAYPHKAVNYIRLHGRTNFWEGGQSHDVIDQIRRYGIVPEGAYPGMIAGEKRHNHGELISVLESFLNAVLKRKGKRITPVWMDAYKSVLDAYLGVPPEEFEYKGKQYTPKSFFEEYVGLNLDDYIEITSYSHHPFYRKCRLEIPDNWTFSSDYYNVPIDDLERIADHALKNGYSVAWDGDWSEKYFNDRIEGVAVVPLKDWEYQTKAEREEEITEPVKERDVAQECRQKTFDNFTTTDDHLMHIVGLARDQKGTKLYLTKDSFGTDNKYKGYLYLSRSYFRLKTLFIMVNKHALPSDIKIKLGLQ